MYEDPVRCLYMDVTGEEESVDNKADELYDNVYMEPHIVIENSHYEA